MDLIIKIRMKIGFMINSITPKNFVFIILRGKLRGKKWYLRSSNPGVIFGLHDEYELIRELDNQLTTNSVFYDVGANVGFFTLLTSNISKNGRVIAFEPFPSNLFYLKEHLSMNNVKNVEIIESALSDSSGTTNFFIHGEGHGNITGDIYEFKEKPIKVPKNTIDELVAKNEIPPPDFVKIDVDGGELLVLKGANNTIGEYKPTLFIETHTEELLKECCNFLKEYNYNLDLLKIEGKSKKQIYAY